MRDEYHGQMKRGDVISGKYRLGTVIGEGGLGVVWSATQIGTNRPVAIKFIKMLKSDSMRRFEVEVRALAQLAHPNCVTLYDVGRDVTGAPYLVMELLTGQPLASARGRHMPIAEVIDIVSSVLEALAAAHARGISHRDLKPENIIITETNGESTVKVVDFGLAKFAGAQGDITKTGEVFGTAPYMSPEQLRGSRDAGPPSDIYSTGVIAWELLQARPLFTGASMLEIGMAHLTKPAPPITRSDCPEPLARLVSQMLSKDARGRPSAVQALKRIHGPAETAEPPDRRATDPPRRRTIWIVAASAALVLLAIVLWYSAYDHESPPAPKFRKEDNTLGGLVKSPVVKQVPTGGTADTRVASSDGGLSTPNVLDADAPISDGRGKPDRRRWTSLNSSGLDAVRWDVRTPTTYDPNSAHPLVIVLPHQGSARSLVEDGGIGEQADKAAALLLTIAPPHGDIWRYEHRIDDAQQFDQILELTRKQFSIDESQMFVIGHGSGGTLANALACEPWVRAIATASYLPDEVHHFGCDARGIPMLLIAPVDSGHVPVAGGKRCIFGDTATSLADYEARWRARNDCDGEPIVSDERDGTCRSWTCDQALVACRIQGGHAWPGTPMVQDLGLFCETHPSDFPSARVVFDFFSQL